jgi:hypothetical protein
MDPDAFRPVSVEPCDTFADAGEGFPDITEWISDESDDYLSDYVSWSDISPR